MLNARHARLVAMLVARPTWIFWLATAAIFSSASSSFPESSTELLKDFFEFRLSLSPEAATAEGYPQYGGQVSARGLAASAKLARGCKDFARRAQAVLAEATEKDDPRTKRYVQLVARDAGECGKAFDEHLCYLLPEANYLESPASLAASFSALRPATASEFELTLTRLRATADHVNGISELLEAGAAANVTYSRVSLNGVIDGINNLQSGHPEDSPFFAPFAFISPAAIPDDGRRAAVGEAARRIVAAEIQPAYRRLATVLARYPARPAAGLWSLAKGDSMYRAALAYYTSVRGVSPSRLHDMGRADVKRLGQRVLDLAHRRLGWKNVTSVAEVFALATGQDDQTFHSAEELMVAAAEVVAGRVEPHMKQILPADHLRGNALEVPLVLGPAGAGPPLYFRAGPLSAGGGAFVVADSDPSRLPKRFEVATVAAHEGLPGHAYQVGHFAQTLPAFLRLRAAEASRASAPCRLADYTAHIEGWALYSEDLAAEMGVFHSPMEMLGYLSGKLLRASRLVADTGIHAFGWTVEDAAEYVAANTALTPTRARAEAARYVTWPGQAAAYAVGAAAIRAARSRRETEAASFSPLSFNLRRFHADVLACLGPVDESLEDCLQMLEDLRQNNG